MAKVKNSAAKAAALASKPPGVFLVDPVIDPVYSSGVVRKYLVTTPSPTLAKRRLIISSKEYLFIGVLLLASAYIRLYNLSNPDSVVFDEVHFGGFAKKYVLGKYFMDVHPPLAKMLFAAVASFGKFKGDFDFKNIGDKYPELTPYVLMRQFPAFLGVGTVVLAYLTLRNSGVRPVIAFVTSFLLLVENSNVTISRYILLDSPLLFFIASAVYAWKKFEIQIPFTTNWFRSLVACGIALGLAVSSKWVGLFTIAWVGLLCLYQLWFIVGDLSVSPKKVVSHVLARGTILLGVPAILYLTFFSVHFLMLSSEGDGSAFMSSAFRATLNGNTIPTNILANVGLGSVVTIRHSNTQGGYLHSHNHFYPAGSKQQQITLYPHLDSNNKWLIEPYNDTIPENTFVPLTDGMKIRLKHVNTARRLHSHDEKPPVSERDWQKEVSCYGHETFPGDANDDFIVEVVRHKTPELAQVNVSAIKTVFRLRHAMTGHYLFSSEVKLPSWGFEQQEVTCASSGVRPLTHWYIETNEHDFVPEDVREITGYPVMSFWKKFAESHARMWKINQGLTDHHSWQSNPIEWPFLLRGINYWVKEHKQVYLFGNAAVWWATSAAIATFGIHFIVSVLKWHLGQTIAADKNVYNFNQQVFSYVLGWALHYFPFFIMGRQLFLHHYLPALYFGILAVGHFLEIFTGYLTAKSKVANKLSYGIVAIFVVISTLVYVHYSSLIYATPWTASQCESSRALSGWDFDCKNFHASLNEYQVSTSDEAQNTSEPVSPSAAQEAKQTDYVPDEVAPDAAESPSAAEEEKVADEKFVQEQPIVPPLAAEAEETPKAENPADPLEVEEIVASNSEGNKAADDVILEEAVVEEAVVEEAVVAEEQ